MIKAQTTLEFIGAFTFFILAVIGILTLTVDEIPQFESYAETTEKNLELKKTTDLLLTTSGSHNYEGGGEDWENHPEHVETPGLASETGYIDRDKLETLQTLGDDEDYYNYTSMARDLNLEHEYNFDFTWFPVVQTHRSFTRTRPPEDPDITEPDTDFYHSSDNRVHYGKIELQNTERMFLVTAYDGVYNTTYVSDSWNFLGRNPAGEDQIPFELSESQIGQDIQIESIQNREDRPGASIVLRTHLREFGRNTETAEGNIEKLTRYPLLDDPGSDDGIVRMEVLAW